MEEKNCARGDSFFLCPSQRLNFLLLLNEVAFPTAFLRETEIPEISFFKKEDTLLISVYRKKLHYSVWETAEEENKAHQKKRKQ